MFGNGNRARQEKKVREQAEKEYGYLGIASMMVKKAGFHEAIDTYIESKTPYLKTEEGKPTLFLNGKKIDRGDGFSDLKVQSVAVQSTYGLWLRIKGSRQLMVQSSWFMATYG